MSKTPVRNFSCVRGKNDDALVIVTVNGDHAIMRHVTSAEPATHADTSTGSTLARWKLDAGRLRLYLDAWPEGTRIFAPRPQSCRPGAQCRTRHLH